MSTAGSCATVCPVVAAPRPVPENYNPRHDPGFESTWLTHLVMHAGQWCRASDVYPPRDEYQRAVMRQLSHEIVQAAKRLGFIVEADPRRGYRVVGHAGLPRYVHLTDPCEKKPANVDGQLSIIDIEAVPVGCQSGLLALPTEASVCRRLR